MTKPGGKLVSGTNIINHERASAPVTASERVVATYELLERILAYLSTIDLIRVQRICKQLYAVITRSQLLQQHLFLEPGLSEIRSESVRLEPYIKYRPGDSSFTKKTLVEPHPLLLSELEFRDDFKTTWNGSIFAKNVLQGQTADVFLTQPPTKKVLVSYPLTDAECPENLCVMLAIEDASGIRFSAVVNGIRECIWRYRRGKDVDDLLGVLLCRDSMDDWYDAVLSDDDEELTGTICLMDVSELRVDPKYYQLRDIPERVGSPHLYFTTRDVHRQARNIINIINDNQERDDFACI